MFDFVFFLFGCLILIPWFGEVLYWTFIVVFEKELKIEWLGRGEGSGRTWGRGKYDLNIFNSKFLSNKDIIRKNMYYERGSKLLF